MQKAVAKKTQQLQGKARQGGWQEEKSLITQTSILEATLECLVNIGYAQTTTEKIAQEAGVSRGAMMHHYKSRDAVIEAAAKYLIEKRASEFDQLIGHVEIPAGALPTLEHMRQTVSILQQYYRAPSFVALHELLRGARTEANLKAVIVRLEKELDERVSRSVLKHFPFWAEIDETREVLMDLVTFAMQGMAVDMAPYLTGERLKYLCDLLAETVMREFTKAYEGKNKKKRKA